MTTLGTARADNGTTTTGAGAHKEAMGTLAAHDGGLIGAFHDAGSCKRENTRLESKMLSLSSQIFFDKKAAGLWITRGKAG